jgi:ABC-2 type transport system ATP-binding protein
MILFEATNASKKIEKNMILSDLSLTISQGEKIAITGKNGSGKSSLLKLIGGIYKETSGKVRRTSNSIGYVPEHFPENIRFKASEYLIFMGKMSGKTNVELMKNIKHYAEVFSILEFLERPLKDCSKGTKQKIGIIQAMLKEPALLLLDEPLTGLDNSTQLELLTQLKSINYKQTIIFTAHHSLLIDKLANRLLIINDGKIISDTTSSENEKYRVITAKVPSQSHNIILDIQPYRYCMNREGLVEVFVSSNESDKVLSMLLDRGCSIIELKGER